MSLVILRVNGRPAGAAVIYMDNRKRYIGIYSEEESRYHEIYAKDCPLWVRQMANKHWEESKMKQVACVRGGALYFKPDSEHAKEIAKQFEVINPEWVQAQKLRNAGKRMAMPERMVSACHALPLDHPWGGGLMVPLYAPVKEFILNATVCRYEGEPLGYELSPDYQPRGYQDDALEEAVRHGHGILTAPCGSGKTVIGVGIIGKFKRRTLVLVHTGDLVAQWRQRLREWIPEALVGVYGLGKKEEGDIVIATIQTLVRMRWSELYEWSKQFGLVILDEAHHAPADTFSYVMTAMPARRFGLTATPERSDGLHPFMYWSFGQEIWKIDHESLVHNNLIMLPEFCFVDTMWTPENERSDYSRAITEMTLSANRNAIIVDIVKKCHDEGRIILVLSDRVGHCESLALEFREAGMPAHALVGKLSPKKRAGVINDLMRGEVRICTATTIADEGLDIPMLDTLVMATPSSSLGRVEQRIGRIMRPHPDKPTPQVYDIRDAWGPTRGSAKKRQQVYSRLGMRWLVCA